MLTIIIPSLASVFAAFFVYSIYAKRAEKSYETRLQKMAVSEKEKSAKKRISTSQVIQNMLSFLGGLALRSNRHFIRYGNYLQGIFSKVENLTAYTPSFFVGIQFMSGLLTAALISYLIETTNPAWLFVFFIAGLFPPLFWAKNLIQSYRRAIFRALPDTIDILTMAMEAGLDFNAAVDRLINRGEKNLLTAEFRKMFHEMQMGKSRSTALEDMSKRVDEPSLTSVVASLIQGLKLGSSLSPILKAQSSEIRVKRSQLAEKLAAEAPLKLLFPLLFFIFPTIFIILFGPIVLMFMKGGF